MGAKAKSFTHPGKVRVAAIIDVGKTNKKLFLFDEAYRIVFERTAKFNEAVDEDGDPCDNIDSIRQSALDTVNELLADPQWEVVAVNFATYGASLVYLDDQGKVLTPLYNYLKDYPQPLLQSFYAHYGGEERLCRETASPALGSLNSGLQLYRLKHQHPEIFKRLRYALHLPQYMSYLISGMPVSDLTSIGCHTHLWNFDQQQYHGWVQQEDLLPYLAPVFPSHEVMSVHVKGHPVWVGAGLHDSSSALIPYLQCFQEPFALLSTGTWCITLNPFNNKPLTAEELRQDCLCYLSYQGTPVKASRLFTGHEHEQQVHRLGSHFQKPDLYYRHIAFDRQIYDELKGRRTEKDYKNGKDVLQRFREQSLEEFADYETAYHCLMLDLVTAQVAASRLVIDDTLVRKIFVDGGFGNNPLFMHMLANALPGMDLYAAEVPQATALGAALAIHEHWNRLPLPKNLVQLRPYATQTLPPLQK